MVSSHVGEWPALVHGADLPAVAKVRGSLGSPYEVIELPSGGAPGRGEVSAPLALQLLRWAGMSVEEVGGCGSGVPPLPGSVSLAAPAPENSVWHFVGRPSSQPRTQAGWLKRAQACSTRSRTAGSCSPLLLMAVAPASWHTTPRRLALDHQSVDMPPVGFQCVMRFSTVVRVNMAQPSSCWTVRRRQRQPR